jgi:hypothetical protein
MIRDKVYKEVFETLGSNPHFESYDFSISSSRISNTTSLSIVYKMENKFNITLRIPHSLTNKDFQEYYLISGTARPGVLAYDESFEFRGYQQIHVKIREWLDNVWEELSSNPIVKEQLNQQKDIEEIFQRFDQIKDEYFSADEAQDLKSRLDELEKKLVEEAKKNIKDKEELQKQIEVLNDDIETLKTTVSSLKKTGWLKSFTGKVFKWTSKKENREFLKEGYSFIKAFLPENIKSDLP